MSISSITEILSVSIFWGTRHLFLWTCEQKAWMNSKRNFNLSIVWHTLYSPNSSSVSSWWQSCPAASVLLRDSRLLYEDPLCFFVNHNYDPPFIPQNSLFKVNSLSLSHHCRPPLCGICGQLPLSFHTRPANRGSWCIGARSTSLLAAWRGGRKEGWREGGMAAEEVYSCLQAGPYLSRHLLWRWPSCHHAADTKQPHTRVSWAALFVSRPACQLLNLSPFPCVSFLLCDSVYTWIFWITHQTSSDRFKRFNTGG